MRVLTSVLVRLRKVCVHIVGYRRFNRALGAMMSTMGRVLTFYFDIDTSHCDVCLSVPHVHFSS